MVRIGGEFTDIVVVDEHNISAFPNKRLIAIVHEDEVTSLSKELPYQSSPGCSFQSHYYNEGAVLRKPRFVLGTPVNPSEIETLIARNKELVEKLRVEDRRVDEAVKSFEKQIKDLTEKLKEMDGKRAYAEQGEIAAKERCDNEAEMRKKMADERTKAVKDLQEYKEAVARVMLLVPGKGEMSVADLVEAEKVGEIMGGESK